MNIYVGRQRRITCPHIDQRNTRHALMQQEHVDRIPERFTFACEIFDYRSIGQHIPRRRGGTGSGESAPR